MIATLPVVTTAAATASAGAVADAKARLRVHDDTNQAERYRRHPDTVLSTDAEP